MIFDSHTHLNAEQFNEDIPETIQRAQEMGVTKMAVVGFDTPTIEKSLQLSHDYPNIYSIIGWHPTEAGSYTKEIENKLQEQLTLPKVVALGEIGLDYYWEKDGDKRQLQRELFSRQLDLARQLHLPVCVHNREAHGDTMEILRKEGKGIVGVMHCFSGSLEIAQELVKMGWFIGVDGPLTFKNAAKLPEIVQKLPLERIVVETDCPYMAPVPMRGKRNEPAFVYHVAAKLAQLRGESLEKVARQTTANALELYPKLSL